MYTIGKTLQNPSSLGMTNMSDPVVEEARSIITRARQSLRDGNTRDAYVWLTYLPPGWFFGRHATSLNMFDAGSLAAEFDRLRGQARAVLAQHAHWSEDQHPRWPAGDEQGRGGQFAPSGAAGGSKRHANIASGPPDPLEPTGSAQGRIASTAGVASSSGTSQVAAANLCPATPSATFVQAHQAAAAEVARQLGVPTQNILGLSGIESRWGRSDVAKHANNYFGLHGGASAPYASGEWRTKPGVAMSAYPSYLASAQSFAAQYGDHVRGIADPRAFAQALVQAGFNAARAGLGNPSFVANTAATIDSAAARMRQCQ
jgi:hypothetical protein